MVIVMMIMVTSGTIVMAMTVTMIKMIGNDHGESDDCDDDYGYGDEGDDVIEMMVAISAVRTMMVRVVITVVIIAMMCR